MLVSLDLYWYGHVAGRLLLRELGSRHDAETALLVLLGAVFLPLALVGVLRGSVSLDLAASAFLIGAILPFAASRMFWGTRRTPEGTKLHVWADAPALRLPAHH